MLADRHPGNAIIAARNGLLGAVIMILNGISCMYVVLYNLDRLSQKVLWEVLWEASFNHGSERRALLARRTARVLAISQSDAASAVQFLAHPGQTAYAITKKHNHFSECRIAPHVATTSTSTSGCFNNGASSPTTNLLQVNVAENAGA